MVIAAIGLLAASCATSDDDDGVAGGTADDGDTAQELVIGAGEDTTVLEPPPEASVAVGYNDPNTPVFEGLVRMEPDFSVEPLLATSWEFEAPATWRFELREDVTFHDGQPFNADAVVYTINELIAMQDSNILAVEPTSAEAIDEFTVEITPAEPNYRLVEQLVHPSNAIMAPGTYAGEGDSPESTPTGTGQFRFVSYEKGRSLEVERFDDYWGEPTALDGISVRFFPDDNARMLALKAGEVDAVYDVPREQANELEDDPNIQIVRSDPGAYDALLLNSHGEAPYDILSDIRVRQAVAHGIDKETIVENVWQGNAEVMNTVIPAPVLSPFDDRIEGLDYDPEMAATLLDDAGWVLGADGVRAQDGRPLELSLWVSSPEEQRPMPELVKAQLAEIGVVVNVEVPGDSNIYFDRLTAGEGDMFAEIGNQNDANPAFLGAIFTGVQPGGFSDYGAAFGPEGEYDELFSEAFTTPDTEEARELAAEFMRIAVDEYVAAIPIAGIYRIWGLSQAVTGFEAHPSRVNQRWAGVSLTDSD